MEFLLHRGHLLLQYFQTSFLTHEEYQDLRCFLQHAAVLAQLRDTECVQSIMTTNFYARSALLPYVGQLLLKDW